MEFSTSREKIKCLSILLKIEKNTQFSVVYYLESFSIRFNYDIGLCKQKNHTRN